MTMSEYKVWSVPAEERKYPEVGFTDSLGNRFHVVTEYDYTTGIESEVPDLVHFTNISLFFGRQDQYGSRLLGLDKQYPNLALGLDVRIPQNRDHHNISVHIESVPKLMERFMAYEAARGAFGMMFDPSTRSWTQATPQQHEWGSMLLGGLADLELRLAGETPE